VSVKECVNVSEKIVYTREREREREREKNE
jgi:hypothetical protein